MTNDILFEAGDYKGYTAYPVFPMEPDKLDVEVRVNGLPFQQYMEIVADNGELYRDGKEDDIVSGIAHQLGSIIANDAFNRRDFRFFELLGYIAEHPCAYCDNPDAYQPDEVCVDCDECVWRWGYCEPGHSDSSALDSLRKRLR